MKISRIWKIKPRKLKVATNSTHFGNGTEILILLLAVLLSLGAIRWILAE